MKHLPEHHRRAGVSFVEILTIVVVLAVLVALLLPVLQAQIARARATECQNRLRQLGVLYLGYAAERNGQVSFFRDGDTSRMWYTELRNYGGLSETDAQRAFGCPSLPASKVTSWVCYGMRLGRIGTSDPGRTERPDDLPNGQRTGYFTLPVRRVVEPSRYFIMADTGTASGSQTFRIIPPGLYSGSGVSLRHQDRANVLFLDGHVVPLTSADLAGLGMTTGVNASGQSMTLSANP